MHCVIFSGGTISRSTLVRSAIKQADFIIAADGGAESALRMGIVPGVVIGDFDSVSPKTMRKLEKKQATLLKFPQEKDETDTELALDYAIKHKATDITILGGNNGDRFDHVIANLLLATTSKVSVKFINGNQVMWIEKGPIIRTISGKKGDLLSLIPLLGDVKGVTLEGLQYGLKNETLAFGKPRGVSNVFLGKKASVQFAKGLLLIVYTSV
ncbi:MAG TPA: thiamine diphosphokinase [Patescibacteria group bacterium]|nr:thiamine diphosphokinase [Patescibacteria group bacterium]